MRGWEIDVPEVCAMLDHGDCVQEAFRLVIDLGDDAGASHLPVVPFTLAAQGDLLTGEEFVGESQNAAVMTDQQGLGGEFNFRTVAGDPRCLHRHTKAHTVTLPKSFGAHRTRFGQRVSYLRRLARCLWAGGPVGAGLVVPTNSLAVARDDHCGTIILLG